MHIWRPASQGEGGASPQVLRPEQSWRIQRASEKASAEQGPRGEVK